MTVSVVKVQDAPFPPLVFATCRETLRTLERGQLRRTINGDLIHVGPKIQKYESTIESEEGLPPSVGALEQGALVTLESSQRLWHTEEVTGDGEALVITLSKTAVPGSVLATTQDGTPLASEGTGTEVRLTGPCQEGKIFVSYRPCLTMRLKRFQSHYDEATLKTKWVMILVEC